MSEELQENGPEIITPYWNETAPITVPMTGRHTYRISANFNVVEWANFKVDVYNGVITRAYEGNYYFMVGTTANLGVQNNGLEAVYHFDFAASIPWVNGPAWNGALRARFGGVRLNTMTRVLYTDIY